MKKLFTLALVSILCTLGLDSYAQNFKTAVASGKDSYIELQGNYDLGGATVKIPDNCTLFFKGGKVTNGTIDFNGCKILGDPTFLCNVTGDVANDFVDLGWFGLVKGDTADNGPTINKVCASFSRILLPAGTYYFKTPITIPSVKSLEFRGNLVYRGKKNTTAITVTGTTAFISFKGSLSNYKNTNVSFANAGKSSNIVGIDFKNVNNSNIYVNEVNYFNENIRVSGIGEGCCYNRFSFGLIRNANVGLRVYQADAGSKRGWANENTFNGGRFTNFSDWNKNDESYAVMIAGPGTGDKYDSANSLMFNKQSFEGYKTIAYAKNVRNSQFMYARVEGSELFVKFVGNCKDCHITTGYNDGCKHYDASESNMMPLDVDALPSYGSALLGASGNVTLSTVSTKIFKVVLSSAGRVYVSYLEDNSGKKIASTAASGYGRPSSTVSKTYFYFNDSSKKFVNGSDSKEIVFRVPDNVTKISVSIPSGVSNASVISYGSPAFVE